MDRLIYSVFAMWYAWHAFVDNNINWLDDRFITGAVLPPGEAAFSAIVLFLLYLIPLSLVYGVLYLVLRKYAMYAAFALSILMVVGVLPSQGERSVQSVQQRTWEQQQLCYKNETGRYWAEISTQELKRTGCL